MYVKLPENERVNRFIRDFTGITDEFLLSCGETIENARKKINELITVDGDLLIVSHGVHNDRQTLLNNEIDFYVDAKGKEIEGICTYTAAKRLLKTNAWVYWILPPIREYASVIITMHTTTH